jgi:hypothetical protein
MTDSGPTSQDAQSEVRSTLAGAVAQFGAKVLSNATILEGICEDRLPDFPREANLVVAAARADVSSMLTQQVPSVGAESAIRLTANWLANSLSITSEASAWVVGEFALALGFSVAAPQSVSPVSPDSTDAATVLPTSSSTDAVGSETIAPVRAAVVAPGEPPEAIPVPSAQVPSASAGPTRRRRRPAIAVIAVVLIVGAYFGIAASAKLPPFKGAPNAAAIRLAAAQKQLAALIPPLVTNDFKCKVSQAPLAPYSAETLCYASASSSAIPASAVWYFLTPDRAALDSQWRFVLSTDARTRTGAGDCLNFASFVPGCETGWVVGKSATIGRIVEFNYTFTGDPQSPNIQSTVYKDNLVVWLVGYSSEKDRLVQWWAHASQPWLGVKV